MCGCLAQELFFRVGFLMEPFVIAGGFTSQLISHKDGIS